MASNYLSAKEIFEIAGVADREYAFDDIDGCRAAITVISNFVRGKELGGVLTFDSAKPKARHLPVSASGLYLGHVEIKEGIGYMTDFHFGCWQIRLAYQSDRRGRLRCGR